MFRSTLQAAGIIGTACLVFLVASMPTHKRSAETTHVQSTAPDTTITPENVQEIQAEMATVTPEAMRATGPAAQTAASAESQVPRENEVRRTKNPYPAAPFSRDEIDAAARTAIVNIYCSSSGGPIGSVAGSGVIINPQGVILTNAHVAQFLLLASDPSTKLECIIRSGSPAESRWRADILYIPAIWVREHAADIAETQAKSTGEHDYALLVITTSIDGSPLPSVFPFLPLDTREAVAFTGDSVLLAGYPAELAGAANGSILYPATVGTRIEELLTFTKKSVDLISLGNVALAQSGSSGGSVVNAWGRLVGIITTTSEDEAIADRNLRALTLAYIDRDLSVDTGQNLAQFLAGDVRSIAAQFMAITAPTLAQEIASHLP